MAYLQCEIPPSTAPGAPRGSRGTVRASMPVGHGHTRLAMRIALWVLAAALLIIPGYYAAQATESLAVGILAGDIAFLIAVAGWSSVAGEARR